MSELPPCGIYVTTGDIGGVPSGRLVYFHNHGDPGPGIYLPASWRGNRARFSAQGHLLPDESHVSRLEKLPAEGFYRVREAFHCCEKNCRLFEPDSLVQLGYNGSGAAILFIPEWVDGALAIPERGTHIDRDKIDALTRLDVPVRQTPVHEDDADERLLH